MSKASLDGLNLTVFDEIYVQTKDRVPFNTKAPPLAFATQTGVGFDKRKETVDTWSGPTYRYVDKLDENGKRVMRKDYPSVAEQVRVDAPMTPGIYLKNLPQSGFTFEKSVSRWSTSNKWFTINDPRGFQLQIAADNLGDILINAGVLNGDLQGEYVWARNKASIFLCRTSHPAYRDFVSPKITRTNLIPGDVILMGQETTEYEFLGTYYTTRLGTEYRYVHNQTGQIMPDNWRNPSHWNYRATSVHTQQGVTFSTQDSKLVFVFKGEGGQLKVMRQKPTKVKMVREGNPSVLLKTGQPYTIWSNLPASSVALFWDSVEDMEEHGPAFIESHVDTMSAAEKFGGYSYNRESRIFGGDYAYDKANNKVVDAR